MTCSHLLQSQAWGELKSRFGWRVWRHEIETAAVQVLFRQLPLGLTIAYVPKGPVVDWTDQETCRASLAAIHSQARQRRAVFLKVEPDAWVRDAGPAGATACPVHLGEAAVAVLKNSGFIPADTIQPPTSLVIDIRGEEAAVLAAMKQKTRYNIRLAEKKGVTIRLGTLADISTFYNLSLATAARDGFGIHSLDYYAAAYTLFFPERCALLLAELAGQPLAALMVFRQAQIAYYFYGASANEHRDLMPTYLLQWAAIRWARAQGCTCYDLWGIPDADAATLEKEFPARNDGLWGVYRFKRGFGGRVVRSVGAYDYIYRPALYHLYRLWRRRQW